ncbi:MAG: hypothetical protein CK521_04410 [Acidimicrobium sp.]|nr:MAG: hypothetical protein CK521_04410 [Acidimicrobium sp.]
MRSYLRKNNVNFIEVHPNSERYLKHIVPTVGRSIVPCLETPDDHKWDTVQFVPKNSGAEVAELAASLDHCKPGESYVMGMQVVLDSITLA